MTEEIRYEKLLQRQGLREDLPSLDSGEFGFAYDTTQLFIGTDPEKAIDIDFNIINIYPFMNAKQVVQSYLNSSSDYTTYEVNENLTIETESEEKAKEIIDYINTKNASNYGSDSRPIASLQRNVEVITQNNVNDYIHPADHNIHYNPELDFSRPSKKLLVKELDSSSENIFLEYDVNQVFYINVEYILIQNNGWHRRSGTIRVMSDNNTNDNNQIGFVDDHILYNPAINDDFIEFYAEISSSKILIKFTQPVDHTTKIFYRIDRWDIEGIVDEPFNEMPQPEGITMLTANGKTIDANGNNLEA
ncbi:hypothetical protein PBI_SCTP2_5 [Salicola phage SCTP-2]|nr:hypothetical protein PBI_SCTP2_5 [Salicola phage SCTP-2]